MSRLVPRVSGQHDFVMTDAAAARATWASAFADELVGFEPDPATTARATRLAQERADARGRAQRSRDKAKRARELDSAIAEGLAGAFRERRVYDRLRDGEDFSRVAVRIELIFGQAMDKLVLDYGWDRALASKVLNARLLRPADSAYHVR